MLRKDGRAPPTSHLPQMSDVCSKGMHYCVEEWCSRMCCRAETQLLLSGTFCQFSYLNTLFPFLYNH